MVVAVVVALAAVLTTVGTWLAAPRVPVGSGGPAAFVTSFTSGPRPDEDEIVRDALTGGALGWGWYLGVLLMLAIAACAFAVGRGEAQTHGGGGVAP